MGSRAPSGCGLCVVCCPQATPLTESGKPLLTCMFTLVGWGRFELPTSASRTIRARVIHMRPDLRFCRSGLVFVAAAMTARYPLVPLRCGLNVVCLWSVRNGTRCAGCTRNDASAATTARVGIDTPNASSAILGQAIESSSNGTLVNAPRAPSARILTRCIRPVQVRRGSSGSAARHVGAFGEDPRVAHA